MMVERIGKPAMYEQLAEECTELAQAALKLARIERRENPTPVTYSDACVNLVEEYSDVVQCANELQIHADSEIMKEKQERFLKRWYGANGDKVAKS